MILNPYLKCKYIFEGTDFFLNIYKKIKLYFKILIFITFVLNPLFKGICLDIIGSMTFFGGQNAIYQSQFHV